MPGPLDLTLAFGYQAREAIAWIGSRALMQSSNPDADAVSQLCRKLVDDLGAMEVDLHFPVRHVLCELADALRAKGEADAVARVEKLVRMLKHEKHQLILGTVDLTLPSPAAVRAQLDQIDKALAKQERG